MNMDPSIWGNSRLCSSAPLLPILNSRPIEPPVSGKPISSFDPNPPSGSVHFTPPPPSHHPPTIKQDEELDLEKHKNNQIFLSEKQTVEKTISTIASTYNILSETSKHYFNKLLKQFLSTCEEGFHSPPSSTDRLSSGFPYPTFLRPPSNNSADPLQLKFAAPTTILHSDRTTSNKTLNQFDRQPNWNVGTHLEFPTPPKTDNIEDRTIPSLKSYPITKLDLPNTTFDRHSDVSHKESSSSWGEPLANVFRKDLSRFENRFGAQYLSTLALQDPKTDYKRPRIEKDQSESQPQKDQSSSSPQQSIPERPTASPNSPLGRTSDSTKRPLTPPLLLPSLSANSPIAAPFSSPGSPPTIISREVADRSFGSSSSSAPNSSNPLGNSSFLHRVNALNATGTSANGNNGLTSTSSTSNNPTATPSPNSSNGAVNGQRSPNTATRAAPLSPPTASPTPITLTPLNPINHSNNPTSEGGPRALSPSNSGSLSPGPVSSNALVLHHSHDPNRSDYGPIRYREKLHLVARRSPTQPLPDSFRSFHPKDSPTEKQKRVNWSFEDLNLLRKHLCEGITSQKLLSEKIPEKSLSEVQAKLLTLKRKAKVQGMRIDDQVRSRMVAALDTQIMKKSTSLHSGTKSSSSSLHTVISNPRTSFASSVTSLLSLSSPSLIPTHGHHRSFGSSNSSSSLLPLASSSLGFSSSSSLGLKPQFDAASEPLTLRTTD